MLGLLQALVEAVHLVAQLGLGTLKGLGVCLSLVQRLLQLPCLQGRAAGEL